MPGIKEYDISSRSRAINKFVLEANLEEGKEHEYYQLCGNTVERTKGRGGGHMHLETKRLQEKP